MAKLSADDVRALLKQSNQFTDEQISAYSAGQLHAIGEGYMRQSDYDAAMNTGKAELAKAQTDLETANQRVLAEMAEWAEIKRKDGVVTQKMRDDLDAAQARVLALQQRVTRIATDAGLDPAKALEGIDQTPPPPPKPAAPDLTGVVKTEEFNQQFGTLANMALTLPAELDALRDEHQELFGKRLDTRTVIKELQTRANTRGNQKTLDPRAIWEELNGVAARREAVTAENQAKRDAQMREEGRVAALSEATVPGSVTSPGRHSVVFGEKARESALKRPQPGQTTNAAAAAFRTGKYRNAKEGAGGPAGT